MAKHLLYICLIVFSGQNCAQSENTWTKKTDFGGLKREKAIAFSIGSYGYVGTGVDTAEITHDDLWQYNPELDSWSQMASIPGSERRNAVAFSIADKGYVGTGFSHDDSELGVKLKDFWVYDPSGNTWDVIADYPGGGDTGLYSATAFSVLGKGYVACGKIGPDAYIFELWEYNPDTDSWSERTPFPGGDRYQLMSFVVENKAYVGMGTDHDVFRKDFYEYNPVTNTWTDAPEFPGSERAQGSTFSIGTKGFVIFGSDGGYKDELWEFNYYTQSWTIRAPFPGGGRKYGVAFSIEDKAYVGTGKESSGKKQSFYEYTPLGPLSVYEEESLDFELYPNPITHYSTVKLPQEVNKGKYLIINASGDFFYKHSFSTNTFEIARNNWPNGIYYLIIQNTNGNVIGIKKISLI